MRGPLADLFLQQAETSEIDFGHLAGLTFHGANRYGSSSAEVAPLAGKR